VTKVFFNYADRKPYFKEKKRIRSFIPKIFEQEGKHLEKLNYIFCSDKYLLRLNKKFLHHNTYTDIITFNLSDTENIIKGEIFISSDRVKDNAITYHTPLNKEFLRVIFHGALHLCGYKDKENFDIKEMRLRENLYINLFHVKHS
jgi:probable rRNA maturation factor